MFRDCSTGRTHQGREHFHFELHCHKPGNWFKYQALKRKSSDTFTGNPRCGGCGRGRDATAPAWMTKQGSNTYGPSTSNSGNDGDEYSRSKGKARNQFVISVRCCNNINANLRRMPITISNELPHVSFPIGQNWRSIEYG